MSTWVLASELMEGARAVERGFVTPDRTLLIASTHRVFAMTEKIALADGRADAAALLAACRDAARQLVAFDMEALADATGSALSAVLFGALAGSGALPFARTAFEAAIRRGQVGGQQQPSPRSAPGSRRRARVRCPQARPSTMTSAMRPPRTADIATMASAASRVKRSRSWLRRSKRLHDYQDHAYVRDFLARLERFQEIERQHGDGSGRLLEETARQLALAMTYEDTIRVADLKIRASRFARVREEAQVADGRYSKSPNSSIPARRRLPTRFQPPPDAGSCARDGPAACSIARPARARSSRPRRSAASCCFTPCRSSSRCVGASMRFAAEQAALTDWLDLVAETARSDYALALQVRAHAQPGQGLRRHS